MAFTAVILSTLDSATRERGEGVFIKHLDHGRFIPRDLPFATDLLLFAFT